MSTPHHRPTPFLTTLLADELHRHRSNTVFRTVRDKHLRRSTFQRRIWAPAVHGTTRPDGTHWTEINPKLTFHSLRHSHKTWLIEDGIPDVAQARRLGHRMDHKINDIYSHVAPQVEHNLLNALQTRWQRSLPRRIPRTTASTTATPDRSPPEYPSPVLGPLSKAAPGHFTAPPPAQSIRPHRRH
ncbi:tyrosine-type recombinase/integrase [Streptacidiphilus sp. PB12-B1b]|uniref:tyrosine-type recombinase/integrase n=1 Tax=Streptacidiphilus sp. PB12-B1b TaxID=2705012 RepID=UPI001CDCF825|nr:tyrosine-type recombinase/integrase [Streptacidiphilus sp. PB12-B1b]